jgi:thioredoxin 1
MKKILIIVFIIIAVIVIGAFALKQSSLDMEVPEEELGGENMAAEENYSTTEENQITDETTITQAGSYELYSPEKISKAENGKVVLFFRAGWCPTCRALDSDIRTHLKDIPADLTILDVDYDNSTALKQKYGVTYQHTLVRVDENGELIKKWGKSETLSDLVSQI